MENKESNQAAAEQMPAIEADRMPFDEALLKETEEYMTKVLKAVPEIGGLAVIPVWNNPTDNMPPGFLRVRNPKEPPMAAMLQLTQNMAKFSIMLDRELLNQYRFFDERVGELMKKYEEAAANAQQNENESK